MSETTQQSLSDIVAFEQFEPEDQMFAQCNGHQPLDVPKSMRMEYLRAIATLSTLVRDQKLLIEAQIEKITKHEQQLYYLYEQINVLKRSIDCSQHQ